MKNPLQESPDLDANCSILKMSTSTGKVQLSEYLIESAATELLHRVL